MVAKQYFEKYLEGTGVTLNGNKPYDIQVHHDRLYSRALFNPSLAVGEGYMEGSWDCDQIDELFFRIFRLHQNETYLKKGMYFYYYLKNHFFNLQTRMRSKKVAERHYNLGNELYSNMLGPTMAYTCAYWKNASTLDQAQKDKFDLVCRKIHLKSTDHVLELGCGWGSFAKFAAENYGCKVEAVNISVEQVRYARESCKGLPIQVHLCDYRDSKIYNPKNIQFDKVVSIGLCEHVGPKNYRRFMQIVNQNIKEEGLFLLHTIGKDVTDYFIDPWINKYIFPGGMLPTIQLLGGAMEDLFILEDLHNFGADYDKTLMAWYQNFNENWDHLKSQYDERFYRMWKYYLLSCAGGFRSRTLQLWQMVLSPHGELGGYQTIR